MKLSELYIVCHWNDQLFFEKHGFVYFVCVLQIIDFRWKSLFFHWTFYSLYEYLLELMDFALRISDSSLKLFRCSLICIVDYGCVWKSTFAIRNLRMFYMFIVSHCYVFGIHCFSIAISPSVLLLLLKTIDLFLKFLEFIAF